MRTNPSLSPHLQQFEDKLTQSFIPTLLNEEDRPLSDFDRQLYSLPAKLGGLAIRNPVKEAGPALDLSILSTKPTLSLLDQGLVYDYPIEKRKADMRDRKHLIFVLNQKSKSHCFNELIPSKRR